MRIQPFDRYQRASSYLHRLDPRVKVVLTALGILSNLLIPDGAWSAFLLTLALILFLTHLAKLPWGFILKRSLIILPFTITAFSVIFITPGATLTMLHLGPWSFTVTDTGVIRFVSILARGILSVQMAILLTATTTFADLLHALRHLRLPRALVGTLAFTFRYLDVLADEAMRLMRARQARSARLPGEPVRQGLRWRGKVTGAMVGQLFLRSLERGERVHYAMLARGFRGHIYTLNPHSMTGDDWVFALVGGLSLLAIQLLAKLDLLLSP